MRFSYWYNTFSFELNSTFRDNYWLWGQFLYVLLIGLIRLCDLTQLWRVFLHRYPVCCVSMACWCAAHPAHASSSAGFGPQYSWGCGTCRAWRWDWRCHPCWTTGVQPAPQCSDTPAPVSVSPDWKKTFVRNEKNHTFLAGKLQLRAIKIKCVLQNWGISCKDVKSFRRIDHTKTPPRRFSSTLC